MSQPAKKKEDHANSERDEKKTSNEYENFENAVRRIMRMSPEEAEKIRKENPTEEDTSN